MKIYYNARYTLKFLTLRTSKVRVFTPLIVKMPSLRLRAKGISAKPSFAYRRIFADVIVYIFPH